MKRNIFKLSTLLILIVALSGCFNDSNSSTKQKDTLVENCEKNDAEACYQLAKKYKLGMDYVSAFKFYSKACESNHSQACYNLAYMYRNGDGVKANIQKAENMLLQSCDNGNANACLSLGMMYNYGHKVEENIQKAIELYTKGCSLGNITSCSNAGTISLQQSNEEKAEEFFTKACENGSADDCLRVRSNLFFIKDFQMQCKDEQKAQEFYLKAIAICNKGDADACMTIAKIHERNAGFGTNKDPEEVKKNTEYRSKAQSIYLKECDNGNVDACIELEKQTKNPQETKEYLSRTKSIYLKECDNGNADSCIKFLDRENFDETMSVIAEKCDQGNSYACYPIAYIYSISGKSAKAKEYYSKACNLGHIQACNKLNEI